jgi:hypothetical protein
MEVEQFFEDYAVGDKRTTSGRTITETDIVVHAGIRVIFSRTTWMRNGARRSRSARGLPTER